MGDVSLVTGASSGLGEQIAKLLCEKGHTVYVVARRKERLKYLEKACSNDDGQIKILAGDISDLKFCEKVVSTIIKKEKKIDYLINNAGFGRSTLLENESAEEISKMFEVNVVAYIHLSKLVLPYMKKKKKGRLIHIGSVVAFTPLPYFTVYNATKAAVYSFNRSLRYELKGTGVSSTVVLPARMKTGFADSAYHCYKEYGEKLCAKEFNSIAGSPYRVAKVIIKNLDSGKEVITPTIKAKIWYLTRYVGFIVDFAMKYFLGPKEREKLNKVKAKELRDSKIKNAK